METLRVPVADEAGIIVRSRFQTFLERYKHHDDETLSNQQRLASNYMHQIATMIHNNKTTVYVNFQHVAEADHELAEAIELEYFRFDPYLRYAIHEIVAGVDQNYVYDVDKGQRELHVSFYNMPAIERIRSMTTDKIGRLISICGTVTRSSEVRPELMYAHFVCRECGNGIPFVEQQFQYTEPQICKNAQCKKSSGFQLQMERSHFVDWQRLRMQENADEMPAGSMPRCMDVICRNEIVEIAKAGDKVILTGFVAVVPETSGSKNGENTMSGRNVGRGDAAGDGFRGLKKLGVKEMIYRIIFIACAVQQTDQRTGIAIPSTIFGNTQEGKGQTQDECAVPELTEAEKSDIRSMRDERNVYGLMADSICPSVFGHTDVKRGILLMLLGGVHKRTKEGISLRGDINVCIIGDPSCAKSQFLKYVHGFLPRTVYTAGKSSSAAGLTASVVRDSDTGDFCVEAGALMLADNGICCIDEFDKMDPTDQVAIHEAMEQQTISITKAGIQATLNARTSVLAAANPVFGRYDKSKTLKANINVSAAIMSRFDLFFVILDQVQPEVDEQIARHIISVHRKGGVKAAEQSKSVNGKFTREKIQKYIQFARTLNPKFTPESSAELVQCYRLLRQNDMLGKNKTAYRITVRQLESLVRLSEALARLHLEPYILPMYVKEAYRLLQKSIIFVESEDIELEETEEDLAQLLEFRKRKRGQDADDDDEVKENVREALNAGTSPLMLSRQDSGGSGYGVDEPISLHQPMDVTEEGDAEKKAAEPPLKKPKSKMSAEDYGTIRNLLVWKLKVLEEDSNFMGVHWGTLVTWYITEGVPEEFPTEEAKQERIKLLNQIIRRMIKRESSIMVLNDNAPDNNSKLLKKHPSCQD